MDCRSYTCCGRRSLVDTRRYGSEYDATTSKVMMIGMTHIIRDNNEMKGKKETLLYYINHSLMDGRFGFPSKNNTCFRTT